VNKYSRNHAPSWRLKLTAAFMAALVLALTVIAASPQLHHWLHGHSVVSVKSDASATGDDVRPAEQDDSGCVVAMFANGVVLGALGLIAISALWRFMRLILRVEMAAYRQTPRYWLPPLCGPPLS
jgi:hypothetical protein